MVAINFNIKIYIKHDKIVPKKIKIDVPIQKCL